MMKTLAVYCGASHGVNPIYTDAARALAGALVEHNIGLVYGGGKVGLMGVIADEVLRDRRHLAGDGLVVPVVAINGQTGALEQAPELITRGLAVDARHEAMLREAPDILAKAIESAPREERTDPGLLKERIRVELQRLFKKRAGRRPLVLPVVMEV